MNGTRGFLNLLLCAVSAERVEAWAPPPQPEEGSLRLERPPPCPTTLGACPALKSCLWE